VDLLSNSFLLRGRDVYSDHITAVTLALHGRWKHLLVYCRSHVVHYRDTEDET
jgi:hypothetical protein